MYWGEKRGALRSYFVGLGLGVLENPGMSLVGHFGQDEQVIVAKALCLLPLVVALVEPLEGDVVAHTVVCGVLPDGCFDAANTHFVDGPLFVEHKDSPYGLGDYVRSPLHSDKSCQVGCSQRDVACEVRKVHNSPALFPALQKGSLWVISRTI